MEKGDMRGMARGNGDVMRDKEDGELFLSVQVL